MLTDVAETLETRRKSHQQLHQSHKLTGNVGGQWRETLQGTLLRKTYTEWTIAPYYAWVLGIEVKPDRFAT